MSVKLIFDIIKAVLFIVAIGVGFYASKINTKNKALASIEKWAADYVRLYETFEDMSGEAKMHATKAAVEGMLARYGIKVDSTLLDRIQGAAEKEVAEMNKNKVNPKQSILSKGTADSVNDFDESKVQDLAVTPSQLGAGQNA